MPVPASDPAPAGTLATLSSRAPAWTGGDAAWFTDALVRIVRGGTPAHESLEAWLALSQVAPEGLAEQAEAAVRDALRAGPPVWRADVLDRAVFVRRLYLPGHLPWQTPVITDAAALEWVVAAVAPSAAEARRGMRSDPASAQHARTAMLQVLAGAARAPALAGPALERLQAVGQYLSDVQQALEAMGRASELPARLWRGRPVAERRALAASSGNMDGLRRLVDTGDRQTLVDLLARADLRADVQEALAAALGATLDASGALELGVSVLDRRHQVAGVWEQAKRLSQLASWPGLAPAVRAAARALLLTRTRAAWTAEGADGAPGGGDPSELRLWSEAWATAAHSVLRDPTRTLVGTPATPGGAPRTGLEGDWDAVVTEMLTLDDRLLGGLWLRLQDAAPRALAQLARALGPERVGRLLESPHVRAPDVTALALAAPEMLAAVPAAHWARLLSGSDRDRRLALLAARGAAQRAVGAVDALPEAVEDVAPLPVPAGRGPR